jgi:hypothetical protein
MGAMKPKDGRHDVLSGRYMQFHPAGKQGHWVVSRMAGLGLGHQVGESTNQQLGKVGVGA